MSWRIVGIVHGSVFFTDPADEVRIGRYGLHGGEDVVASRDTFRSVGKR